MFRLYYAPGTCALATHIALEEAGAPHDAVPVDFGSQSQRSPEYLAVNPKGRVPALVTENGTLTETPGLLLFVAQRFPLQKRVAADRIDMPIILITGYGGRRGGAFSLFGLAAPWRNGRARLLGADDRQTRPYSRNSRSARFSTT